MSTLPFINEFHYDNTSGDTGEFIEIAGLAGTNLAGYSLLLYNGNPTQLNVYATIVLSGVISNVASGYGFLSFAAVGLQNGNGTHNEPDGIALVGPGNVVLEFISYEGSFTAATGAAAGLSSVNVGVIEPGTANGTSIARTGTGTMGSNFTWVLDGNDTPGALNNGQTFTAAAPTVSINDVAVAEGNAGTTLLTFTVTRSDTSTAFTVDFATQDGSATTANGDYVASSGSLVFAAGGPATQVVSITVNGDLAVEPSETLTVLLSNLVNTVGGTVLGDASGVGTLQTDDIGITKIHAIQGTAFFSPVLAAEGISTFNVASAAQVTVTGVVTALDSFGTVQGFYLAEEVADWDASANTSEGIFVRTLAPIAGLTVGETVTLTASVMEYQDFTNLNRTMLVNPVDVVQGNDLVALPTLVLDGTPGKRIPNRIVSDDSPVFTDSVDDPDDTFDPENDGLDFYETIEGMRVTITDMVVADGFVGGSNPDFVFFNAYSLAHADPTLMNSRGGYTITGDPQFYPLDTPGTTDDVIAGGRHLTDGVIHPDILELDFGNVGRGGASAFDELLTMGDALGDVSGIIDFDFGVTKFYVTDALDPLAVAGLGAAPVQEVTTLDHDARSLRIASFNVENLSPVGTTFSTNNGVEITTQEKYDALAAHIAVNLKAPDILIIEEIQDDNGVTQDGVTEAGVTWGQLVAAVNAASGRTYQWVDEAPTVSGDVGGAPGGNIRVGFLYDTARVQLGDLAATASLAERRQFTDRIGDGVRDAGDLIAVDDSQLGAEIVTADWAGTRRSIVGEFSFNGQSVFVFGSHLPSKGGSGEPYQLNQDIGSGNPANGDWAQRNTLAQDLWAMQNLVSTTVVDGRVVSGGDFNEFWFYRPLEVLSGYVDAAGVGRVGGTRYTNLMVQELPDAERFSYDFDGRSQALDTLLADAAMSAVASFDIVHVNTGYNERTGAVNPASSDHDPSLASFDMRDFGEVLASTAADEVLQGFGGNDVITWSGSATGTDTVDGGSGTDELRALADGTVFRLRSVTGVELVNGNGFANVTVLGTGDADTLDFGGATLVGIVRIDAGAGNDTVTGGDSADTIVGGDGNDTLAGGGGGDLFLVGPGAGIDAYAGGEGTDRIQATAANTTILISALSGIEEIHAGGFGGVTVVGSVAGDVLDFSGTVLTGIRLVNGGNGNDTIIGSAGADVIFGNLGTDTISADEGNDTIRFGVNTNDFIDGGAGIDTLVSMVDGSSLVWTRVSGVEVVNAYATFDEALLGTAGSDVLDFSAVALLDVSRIDVLGGADTVIGSVGTDFIVGGAGADTLTGGGSADVFAFERTTDSNAAVFDTITDFLPGTDLLDLSLLDATAGVAGDQAFAFLGVAAFGGVAGQLRVDAGTPGITAIEMDIDGNAIADMRIELIGTHALQATDLVL